MVGLLMLSLGVVTIGVFAFGAWAFLGRRELRSELLATQRELVEARGQIDRLEAVPDEASGRDQRSLQAQKMEAIGRLVGGVAHDFNNVLTAIIGASSLMLERLGPTDPARSDAQIILTSAERAAALVSRLLSFTRGKLRKPVAVDVNDAVRSIALLLERVLGDDIALELDLDNGQPSIDVDPAELEQVLLNLALNARDAMSGGGVLSVSSGIHVRDEEELLRLSVRDTGTGMDEATRQRVFEPFFTTKAVGEGTGLGLANVFGVVERAGGRIEVSSELGEGTVFHLDFPLVEAAEDEDPQDDVSHLDMMPSSVGVMVVEDNDAVREVLVAALESQGFRVVQAADGVEALELAGSETLHVLVTDVAMPRLGGFELAKTMRERSPKLRVLFMSGYSTTQIGLESLDARARWLPKPFTPSALLRALDDLLAGA